MQWILTGNQNTDIAIVAACLIAFVVYRVTRCLERRSAHLAWASVSGSKTTNLFICNGDHDDPEDHPQKPAGETVTH